MTDIIEVHNRATGRNEMIPEDWLDSPILNHDVNGELLERVVPAQVVAALERPTVTSTHAVIDAFAQDALGPEYKFPDGVTTREQKMAVLDELVPASEPDAPPVPESDPDVQLTGPASDEPVVGEPVDPTQADDEEN